MKIVQIMNTEEGLWGLDEDGGLWEFYFGWEPKIVGQEGSTRGWRFLCSSEARSVKITKGAEDAHK